MRLRWTILAASAVGLLGCGERQLAEPVEVEQLAENEKIDQRVLNALAQDDSAAFWINLTTQADLEEAASIGDWDARGWFVYDTLRAHASATQANITGILASMGADYRPYWITNSIFVRDAGTTLLNTVAGRPEVASITPRVTVGVPVPEPASDVPSIEAVEWGLSNINAPDVWSTYTTGEGIVVAGIDTGVAYTHAALVNQYRGNLGGGSFDHDYNFFDPTNTCTSEPCDNNDHGTHTMGTMVGDDGGSNQIGVAPGAEWIACKGCGSSSCADSSLLACGEWVLAPTDSAGGNADPSKRPHVVNNSWGGGGGNTFYEATVNAWVAAGLFPAFSNGNSGSSCSTSGSPGDFPQSYSSGAYDSSNSIASFSSRGPSAFADEIKPNIAAPGVAVRSAVRSGGYSSFNGTSMASPHTAGVVALMWAAAPSLVGDLDNTRLFLDDGARDTASTQCGGTTDDNNVWGEGRIDAFASVELAVGGIPPSGTLSGTVTDETGTPIAGATVEANGPANKVATTDTAGAYTMDLRVGTYEVTASAPGYFGSAVATVDILEDQTTVQDFSLEPTNVGQATFSAVYQAPSCDQLRSGCDSGTLLDGRDNLSGGAEPNQPNTLYDSCADGTSGTYHSDESLDRIVVTTTDGGDLAPGKEALVEVTVWAWNNGSSDALDLYYTADAASNPPSWEFIGTFAPPGGGAQTLTATYTLPDGAVQAVRGNFRYTGSASPCSTGSYDDHDDLVFFVGGSGPVDGELTGAVTDAETGGPIAGATVDAVGPVSQSTTTDATGGYSMTLPEGNYTVSVSAAGYVTSSSSATVVAGQVTTTDVALEPVVSDEAVYDPTYQAPACNQVGSVCDSGTLLDGRDNITGGAEPNQPNTLYGSCADGTSGSYHGDESIDAIVVSTTDGGAFAAGKTVSVDVTVWAWSTGSSDYLDLYYTADATTNPPVWTSLGTLQPSGGGLQILSTTYTLPAGAVQAVRANFRYQGSASSCSTGSYDDHDDLVFRVEGGGGGGCTPIYTADFESGAGGWAFSSGDSTCSTGDWTVGDPDFVSDSGVVTQLEDDHTAAPGVNAFFTAPNSGGAGTDDVDGGVCTGYSPVIDASAHGSVEVSLWYYHGQRDAGDDSSGDYFRIDLSTDGGATYGTSLVSFGDVTSNAAWTEVTVPVANPGQLRLRVQASDGSAAGDLVEGGIDDVIVCVPDA